MLQTSDLRRAWPVALLVGALCLASACGGGASSKSEKKLPTGVKLQITPGAVVVASGGGHGHLSSADIAAITNTVRRYVTDATVNPLRGAPTTDLAAAFLPTAAAGINPRTSAALTDVGAPRATSITATARPLMITALSDPSNAIGLVAVPLDLRVTALTNQGALQIHRTGEFALRRSGAGWKISSFRVLVSRGGAALGATTAKSSASGRTS